ncbi:MAG TPA: aminoglycoside phosphotransferase family protein [Rhizomicrobium sp.]|nr:aminoglycoside phosphotransferase family protein [Rhizomicrobium sp.]
MSVKLKAEDHEAIAAALRRMKLMAERQSFTADILSGGVSCDVWHVALDDGRDMIVKRALPRLRVEADWRAPAERASTEADWFRLVAGIDPRWVPEVLGEDRPHHIFAMEYLPPETHRLWKAELAEGRADAEFAAQVGEALAHIHAATANREDVRHDFAHDTQFHALRLEPYLLHMAKKHPDIAPRIRALADGIARARIALMQGDISPKNILIGAEGPVFLDAETACYGDPAFDLAFCLNHLLLKCVWHRKFAADYLKSFATLSRRYLDNVTWEEPRDTEARTAALLPTLLLARIDGKSPVEYLTAEKDKSFVRETARKMLAAKPATLDTIAESWSTALKA